MEGVPWRGCHLDCHPAHNRPSVVTEHDGPVWSVALSSQFLVSAGDDDFLLRVHDARKSNDAPYRKLRRTSDGLAIDGVMIARTVQSWHLALRGSMLVVLGRLIDLSRLCEDRPGLSRSTIGAGEVHSLHKLSFRDAPMPRGYRNGALYSVELPRGYRNGKRALPECHVIIAHRKKRLTD